MANNTKKKKKEQGKDTINCIHRGLSSLGALGSELAHCFKRMTTLMHQEKTSNPWFNKVFHKKSPHFEILKEEKKSVPKPKAYAPGRKAASYSPAKYNNYAPAP